MITEEKKQVLEHFAEGRKLYKLMKFEEARDAFAQALKIVPRGRAVQGVLRALQALHREPAARRLGRRIRDEDEVTG